MIDLRVVAAIRGSFWRGVMRSLRSGACQGVSSEQMEVVRLENNEAVCVRGERELAQGLTALTVLVEDGSQHPHGSQQLPLTSVP